MKSTKLKRTNMSFYDLRSGRENITPDVPEYVKRINLLPLSSVSSISTIAHKIAHLLKIFQLNLRL